MNMFFSRLVILQLLTTFLADFSYIQSELVWIRVRVINTVLLRLSVVAKHEMVM